MLHWLPWFQLSVAFALKISRVQFPTVLFQAHALHRGPSFQRPKMAPNKGVSCLRGQWVSDWTAHWEYWQGSLEVLMGLVESLPLGFFLKNPTIPPGDSPLQPGMRTSSPGLAGVGSLMGGHWSPSSPSLLTSDGPY